MASCPFIQVHVNWSNIEWKFNKATQNLTPGPLAIESDTLVTASCKELINFLTVWTFPDRCYHCCDILYDIVFCSGVLNVTSAVRHSLCQRVTLAQTGSLTPAVCMQAFCGDRVCSYPWATTLCGRPSCATTEQ